MFDILIRNAALSDGRAGIDVACAVKNPERAFDKGIDVVGGIPVTTRRPAQASKTAMNCFRGAVPVLFQSRRYL